MFFTPLCKYNIDLAHTAAPFSFPRTFLQRCHPFACLWTHLAFQPPLRLIPLLGVICAIYMYPRSWFQIICPRRFYWGFSGTCPIFSEAIFLLSPHVESQKCEAFRMLGHLSHLHPVPNRCLVCSSPSNPAQPAAVRPRMTWESRTRDSCGDESQVLRHLRFQLPVMGSVLMALAVNTFKQKWQTEPNR